MSAASRNSWTLNQHTRRLPPHGLLPPRSCLRLVLRSKGSNWHVVLLLIPFFVQGTCTPLVHAHVGRTGVVAVSARCRLMDARRLDRRRCTVRVPGVGLPSVGQPQATVSNRVAVDGKRDPRPPPAPISPRRWTFSVGRSMFVRYSSGIRRWTFNVRCSMFCRESSSLPPLHPLRVARTLG